ncbi:hypothetical protein H632_c143p1 [Helicosporidium sp. ATCC 50920]|nr:hypothetical protein H632_c143p1 [Helicosporidium sp. ATCC 50920]|eukprot:KDD76668.1 hypothetical protein H632_c143p1 [Helicosporidium sp. ATCC 50920]
MATNEQQIAQAFVQHYFHPLNQKDKGQLAMLYTERSLLTFEGESFAGRDAIMTKLKSIPFQTRIVTVDAQPAEGGAVMVFVTGNAMVSE